MRTWSRSPSGAAPTPTTGSCKRYRGFVRLKASSYFLLGGDSDDLIQEGLLGLYKAIRDFRTDRESSFRNFAELCITRQIITAVKTASRNKHAPLNQYVSFAQTPAGAGDSETTLEEVLPGPGLARTRRAGDRDRGAAEPGLLPRRACSPSSRAASSSLYLDGHSYEEIGERLECDTKTVDNALQRVKRKVGLHLASREVQALGRPSRAIRSPTRRGCRQRATVRVGAIAPADSVLPG